MGNTQSIPPFFKPCLDEKSFAVHSRLFYQSFPRVYLKTPNAPGQRAFSRCAAPFFLEIRQYSCKKTSCSAQKFLAAGHIESFQIHPNQNCPRLDDRGQFLYKFIILNPFFSFSARKFCAPILFFLFLRKKRIAASSEEGCCITLPPGGESSISAVFFFLSKL